LLGQEAGELGIAKKSIYFLLRLLLQSLVNEELAETASFLGYKINQFLHHSQDFEGLIHHSVGLVLGSLLPTLEVSIVVLQAMS